MGPAATATRDHAAEGLSVGGLLAVMKRSSVAIAGWTSWLMIVLSTTSSPARLAWVRPGCGNSSLHTVPRWLGYCYILNAHPRVDTRTVRCEPGLVELWLPVLPCYTGISCLVRHRFVASFAAASSPIGIPQRWVIKFLFVLGLWLLVARRLHILRRVPGRRTARGARRT
jgi:hypothetical protein